MTDKVTQIRTTIIPRLNSLASHLWDDEISKYARKLDNLVDDLNLILDSEGEEDDDVPLYDKTGERIY